MRAGRLLALIGTNLRSSRGSAAFAVLGVAMGASFLTFFVGLGEGLRERVLNRILPANQLELEPRAVRVFGVEGSPTGGKLDAADVERIARLPGVVRALGRSRSVFPAKLWGGRHLIGYDLHTEAFFDGIPAELLRPELAAFEAGLDLGTGRRERCDVDDDCPAGARCDEGLCGEVRWSERFADRALVLRCANDADCAAGARCVAGDDGAVGRCVGPGDAATCAEDADCAGHERCVLGQGQGTCLPRRCRLEREADARTLERVRARGRLARDCDKGAAGCVDEATCPAPSYCAADAPGRVEGACELPVPTVLNPLLLEVFNTDMAASLGIARVAAPEALLGVRYHIALGDSHFTADAARERQQVRQAVVVGFSPKAPELGVTMPLTAVAGWNARFLGAEDGARFDGVIVETEGNERIADTIAAVEKSGLQLSRRSRMARTFGTVVLLVYLALLLLAGLVLAVAALGISHTFAILVHERRREIAVLRALGASAGDIAAMVVGEAAVLGLLGGGLGLLAAKVGALAVDAAAQRFLADLPLLPDALFVFPWWAWPMPLLVGVLFCALGASLPARRATRLDPATVLSQP